MICVGTTLAAFAMDDPDTWGAWLGNAEAIAATHNVEFFAAIQVDARGPAPFAALLARLDELGGRYWTYSLDDGRTEITTANRQLHLATGENLVSAYATNTGATHLLFCAADCEPPADVLPRLLEVDHSIVGAECPTYCLDGPAVAGYDFPVHDQLASAACVLIQRWVFKYLKWRADPDLGLTDDPALRHDARALLATTTYVRKDCIARHRPEAIGPIEGRGHDLAVHR